MLRVRILLEAVKELKKIMGTPIKKYDDDKLCYDLAKAELSQGEIAKKYGLSEVSISFINRGKSRPELQEKIKEFREAIFENAKQMCKGLAEKATKQLGKLIDGGEDIPTQVQHKAIETAFKYIHGDPSRTEVNVSQSNSHNATSLDAEDLENLAKMKGGPE